MKSHVSAGLALALVVLVLLSAVPSSAFAGDGEEDLTLGLVRPTTVAPTATRGLPTGGTDPGTGTVNGDPEDWLGGQNLKPDSNPGKNLTAPDPPSSLFVQIQQWWQSMLRLSAETMAGR